MCVLYLRSDKGCGTICDTQTTNGVTDIRVYYNCGYLSALGHGWRVVKKIWGRPQVCQLNIITKNAVLPLWLNLVHGIPYVVAEHWSGYLPENNSYGGLLHKRLAELTVSRAGAVLPVSMALEKAMQAKGLRNNRYERLYNVVDDFFFLSSDSGLESQDKTAPVHRLLHVSCFDERAKNVKGLLRAMRHVADRRHDWQLVLVGTGADYNEVKNFAETLAFPEGMLVWRGELTPQEVASEMAKAEMFLLFSNYENAPVVISESLAAGVPVIATRTGGIPEMVDEDCGVLVNTGDEDAFAAAVEYVLDGKKTFDRQKLTSKARRCSSEAVGSALLRIYTSLIQ